MTWTCQTPGGRSRRLSFTEPAGDHGSNIDIGPGHNVKLLLERCESGRIGLTANPSLLVQLIWLSPLRALQAAAASIVTNPVAGVSVAFLDRIMDMQRSHIGLRRLSPSR